MDIVIAISTKCLKQKRNDSFAKLYTLNRNQRSIGCVLEIRKSFSNFQRRIYLMKKVSILLSFVFLLSLSAFAQSNFSGTWELDKSKSKLDERMSKMIEGQTLTVSQTEKEFKVETKTKRLPPPEGGAMMGGGRGMGSGGGRGGMMGGGDGTSTYTLDGKEKTVQIDSPMGQQPVVFKGNAEKDGSLKLSQTRTFSGPMGEMTMSTREHWTLSTDGKTLTVKRDTESPRGIMSSESVYKKL
jgi:hypothetical protein